MKKKPSSPWKTPLVLIGLTTAVTSIFWWIEERHIPKQEEAEQTDKRLIKAAPSNVTFFSLEKIGDQSPLTVERATKGDPSTALEITSPLLDSGDAGHLNTLLESATKIIQDQILDLSQDTPEKRAQLLNDYSLGQQPKFKIRVKTPSLDEEVWLGENEPTSDAKYAVVVKNGKPVDSKVYIVSGYGLSFLNEKISHYRNKRVVTVESHQLAEFKLSAGKKSGTQNWKASSRAGYFEGIDGQPGSTNSIQSFFNALNFLEAKDFAEKLPKDTKRSLEIYFTKKDKSVPVSVTFYSNKDQLFVKTSQKELIYELDKAQLDRFDKAPTEFALKSLTEGLKKETVKWISLKNIATQQSSEWIKKDGAWLRDGKSISSEKWPVTFLDKLSVLENGKFLPRAPTAATEKLEIILGEAKGDEFIHFIVGGASPDAWLTDKKWTPAKTFKLKNFESIAIFSDSKAWDEAGLPKPPAQVKTVDPKLHLPSGHSHDDGHGH